MSQIEYITKIQEIIPRIIEQNLSSDLNASLKSISTKLVYSAPELAFSRIKEFFSILNAYNEELNSIYSELKDKLEKAESELNE